MSRVAEYPGHGPGQVEQSAPGLTQVYFTSGSTSGSGIGVSNLVSCPLCFVPLKLVKVLYAERDILSYLEQVND
jgi:hypothetical protein